MVKIACRVAVMGLSPLFNSWRVGRVRSRRHDSTPRYNRSPPTRRPSAGGEKRVADEADAPTRPGAIRRRLEALGVRPYKGWGQNFLIDPTVPRRMVEIAGVGPGDQVVEIGPGLGVLTGPLLASGAEVTAVEIDPRLAGALRERFAAQERLRLVEGDILRLDPAALVPAAAPYTVVANLPYSVTSAVLRHLLAGPRRPRRLVVMVQLEVAQRIVARPPEMSLLTVSVQLFGRAELALRVPAGAFYPPPKVDSAVVAVTVEAPPLPEAEQAGFFRLVAAGFGQRRKMLGNSLAAGLALAPPAVAAVLAGAGIDARRRPETLTVIEWLRLYAAARAAG
jgi:16S rRNA (adenine1518-N6/adenine1519-N6)-dimethyltransferase